MEPSKNPIDRKADPWGRLIYQSLLNKKDATEKETFSELECSPSKRERGRLNTSEEERARRIAKADKEILRYAQSFPQSLANVLAILPSNLKGLIPISVKIEESAPTKKEPEALSLKEQQAKINECRALLVTMESYKKHQSECEKKIAVCSNAATSMGGQLLRNITWLLGGLEKGELRNLSAELGRLKSNTEMAHKPVEICKESLQSFEKQYPELYQKAVSEPGIQKNTVLAPIGVRPVETPVPNHGKHHLSDGVSKELPTNDSKISHNIRQGA